METQKARSHILVGCVRNKQNDSNDRNIGTTVTRELHEAIFCVGWHVVYTVSTFPFDLVVVDIFVRSEGKKRDRLNQAEWRRIIPRAPRGALRAPSGVRRTPRVS